VTRAPTDRSHLSIGEVLSLLQDEFPDVTISKIRFLESQGLLDPERTPSGYRKFYEADIDRLRWILRQQKDHYLPLKVIKDRLDETGPVRTAPTAASHADLDRGDDPAGATTPAMASTSVRAGGGRSGPPARAVRSAVALDDRPDPVPPPEARAEAAPAPVADPPPAPRRPARRPAAAPQAEREREAERTDVADVIEAPLRRPAPSRPAADPTIVLSPSRPAGRSRPAERTGPADAGSVSLTAEELSQASGLPLRAVRELEGYGLLDTHTVGDASYYDADALVIARTAAGFMEHGIEARHIRAYKVAAEREAGLFEQIVLPLLKQRNPEARRRAAQTVAELMRLGDDMRGVLLRRGLRDHLPPAT
jgi:DNA-binding transcriptional MerR regulator